MFLIESCVRYLCFHVCLLQYLIHAFVFQIKLLHVKTSAEYNFDTDTWIKVDGERDYWREFPVVKPSKDDMLKGNESGV